MSALFNLLFGCRHSHRTWPRKRTVADVTTHYQTCLECGRELEYTGPLSKTTCEPYAA